MPDNDITKSYLLLKYEIEQEHIPDLRKALYDADIQYIGELVDLSQPQEFAILEDRTED